MFFVYGQMSEIHMAAGLGKTKKVAQLLAEGRSDIGRRSESESMRGANALLVSSFNGHADVVRYLLDHKVAAIGSTRFGSISLLTLVMMRTIIRSGLQAVVKVSEIE